MSYRSVDPSGSTTLQTSLLNNDTHTYVHLIKFEKPSVNTEVGYKQGSKPSRKANTYSYLTDGGFPVSFNDGSVPSDGSAENGAQDYIPGKVLSVGTVSETIEAKASTMSLTLAASALSAFVTDTFTITSSTVASTTNLLESGFSVGDTVEFSGSGANNGVYVRIDSFSNENKTFNYTTISGTVTTQSSVNYTLSFASEEIASLTASKEGTDYSNYLNREVFIYRAHINPSTGALIGSPFLIFKGIITGSSFDDKVLNSAKVTWTLTSHWGDFVQVTGRITSDHAHRGLDISGVPSEDAVIRPEYVGDLGFRHAEQAINIMATYQTAETRYKLKRKGGLSGLLGGKRLVEYTEMVDRDVDLEFNLGAKYIPIIYGVQKATGIPFFADGEVEEPTKIYVAHAISEGPVHGILDLHVDSNPVICINGPDENDRDSGDAQVLCVGRADRGDVLRGGSVVDTSANIEDQVVEAAEDLVQEGSAQDIIQAIRMLTGPRGYNAINIAHSDGGSGILHENKINLTSPLPTELVFHAGLPDQASNNLFTIKGVAKRFKVQSILYPDQPGSLYWGPAHQVLDTAYATMNFTIGTGEFTIPDYEFVVKGRVLDCFNYDRSYSGKGTHTNFKLGDMVTLHKTEDDTQLGSEQVQIIDKWSFYNSKGTLKYRFRFSKNLQLQDVRGDTNGDVKSFYMKSTDGNSNKWYFAAYNNIVEDAQSTPEPIETQNFSDIAGITSGLSFSTEVVGPAGNARIVINNVPTNLPQFKASSGRVGFEFTLESGETFTSILQYNSYSGGKIRFSLQNSDNSAVVLRNNFNRAASYVMFAPDAVKLNSNSSTVDDEYNNFAIKVLQIELSTGTVVQEQIKTIEDYDGSTRIALLSDGLSFRVDSTNKFKYTMLGDTEVSDGEDIFPSIEDKRVSINPAIQLLDYLTNKRYGKGLDIENDIDLPSFLSVARTCDQQSKVTVLIQSSTAPTVGDKYKYPATGDIAFQGTVESIKQVTFNSLTFQEVTFKDVIGKLLHRWNDYRKYKPNEVLYYEGTAFTTNISSEIGERIDSTSRDSLISSNALNDSTNTFTLTKVGSASTTLDIFLDSGDAYGTASTNPAVRRSSPTGFNRTGYSLYDSDDCVYWVYLGWDEPEQRYVTRHQTNLTVDTSQSVFNNINAMLEQFGGMLRYSNGKYTLAIKTGAPADSHFDTDFTAKDISEDDIIGSVKVQDSGSRKTYNSLNATIVDPANKFGGRGITFMNSEYLKQDRGIKKQGNYNIPGISNYFNARMNIKQQLDESRYGLTVKFTLDQKGYLLLAGDIIRLTYSRFGWSNKYFRINSLNFQANGLVQVVAEEHNNNAYIIDHLESSRGAQGLEGGGQGTFAPAVPGQPGAGNTPPSQDKAGQIELNWVNGGNFSSKIHRTQIARAPEADNVSAPNSSLSNVTIIAEVQTNTFLDSDHERTQNSGTGSNEALATKYDYWVRHIYNTTGTTGTSNPLNKATPWTSLGEGHALPTTQTEISDGITISSGGITMATDPGGEPFIMGGMSDFNTGDGFYLGYDSDKYKFSVGSNTEGEKLVYDGTNLTLEGGQFVVTPSGGTTPSINNTTLTGAGILLKNDGDVLFGDSTGSHVFFDQDAATLTVKGDVTATSLTLTDGATVGNLNASSIEGVTQASFTSIGATDYSPAINGSRVTWTIPANDSGNNWAHKLVSDYGFEGGAFVSFKINQDNATNSRYMVGLADVTTGNSYTDIDYAIFVNQNTNILEYQGSSNEGELKSTVSDGDVCTITYDGSRVRYYINQALVKTVPPLDEAPLSTPFTGPIYAHVAIDNGSTASVEHRIDNLEFGAHASVKQQVESELTVSSGGIVLATSASIRSGQSAFDTGTGFFLGAGTNPKFSIGNSTADKLTFDGSDLTVTGQITADSGAIGGWTIDDDAIFTGTKVTSDAFALADSITIDGTNQRISTNQFRIDSDGSAHFKGAIEGGTISIGSSNDIFKFDATNGLSLGHATPASAPFRVTIGGDLTATNATITGTITADNLSELAGQPITTLTEGSYTDASMGLLSPRVVLQDEDIDYAVLEDGTNIYKNDSILLQALAAGTRGTILNANLSAGDILTSNRPVSFHANGHSLPSLAQTGTQFAVVTTREISQIFRAYAPYSTATVKFVQRTTTLGSTAPDFSSPDFTLNLTAQTVGTLTATTTDPATNYWFIQSDAPIVIMKESTNGVDSGIIRPVAREVFSYDQASIFKFDPSDSSDTITDSTATGATSFEYHRSDVPVSGNSNGDGSGSDSENATPWEFFGDTYVVDHELANYQVATIEPAVVTSYYWSGTAWVLFATHDFSAASRTNFLGATAGADDFTGGTSLGSGAPKPWRFVGTGKFALRTNDRGNKEYFPLGYNSKHRIYDTIRAGRILAEDIQAGTITGDNINATDEIRIGSGANSVVLSGSSGQDTRLWAGSADGSAAPFRVSKDGDVFANSATIKGDITATDNINDAASDNVAVMTGSNSTFRFFAGNHVAANAPFRIEKDGTVHATDLILYKDNVPYFNSSDGFTDAALSQIASATATRVQSLTSTLDNDTAYVEVTLDEASDIVVDADYSALTIFASDSEEYFGDPSNPIFINIDLVTNNGDTKEQNDGAAGILKPTGTAAQLGRAFKVGEYIRIRLTRVSTDGFSITTGANHSATLISGDTSFDATKGDYVYLLYQITGTTSNDFDLTFTREGGSLYTAGTRVHNTLNHTATPNTTTDAKAKLPTSVSIVAQYDTTADFSSPTSISISPSTFTRVDTLTGSPTDELLVDVELNNFKSEDRIESDVAITRNSGAVQADGFFGGNATISSLAAGTYYFRVQITLTGGTVAETNRRLTLTDNTGDGFRIDNGAGDQSTATGDITSVKLDTSNGIQVNTGTTRTETTGQADFSLSLGAITPSSVAPTGAMTLANEQKLIFLKSDGTDDDTSLRKAGGSATRLRYGTNSFIFDSVDDRSLEVRNSDDVAVFTVTPNTTVTNSTVTIAGNLVVQGDTITANTATLNVEDKNITLNYGSGDTSATANGAGITIQDAVSSSQNATMNWNSTSDSFVFSHEIAVFQTSGQIAEFGDSTFADKYIQIRQGAGLRIGISDSLPDTGGGAVFQALDSKPIAFVTNNTSAFADLTSTDVDLFIDEGRGASIGGTNPIAYVNTNQSYLPSNNAGKWLTISNTGATGSYLNLESNASAEDAQLGAVLWTDQGGNTDAHRQVAAIDAIVVPHSSNQGLAGADLRFWTKQIGAAPSNPRMVILESGRVGIGATNPDKLLVVDGANAEVVINDTDSSPTPRLRFREGGTTKAQIQTSGGELVFSVPGTERMRIDTDGRVGIGTNNPDFLLDVNGTFTARDALVRLWEGATSTSNAIEIGQNRTVDGAVFIDFTTEQGQSDFNFRINRGSGANGSTTFRNRGTGSLIFDTNLTEAMRIDGSGNVSIGTTGTGENLRVAGTSRFNVTTSNGFLIDANSTIGDSPFTAAKIDFDVTGNDTLTGDRTHIGLHIDADSSSTGGDTSNEHRLYGLFVEAQAAGDSDLVYANYAFAKATDFGNNNTISSLRALYGLAQPHQDAGRVTFATGAYNLAQNLTSGTGETPNTYGAYNQAQAYSTSSYTSTNYYGSFNIAQVTSSNAVNVNAVYGVHAEVQFDNDTAADHNITVSTAAVIKALYDENDANDSYTVNTGYLFYAQYQGTKPTTAWGLYIDNADKHYLEGNVEIEGALEVEDAGPNLVIDNTLNTTRGSLLLQESGVTKALVQLRGSNETTLPNTMRVGTDSSSNADLLLITNGGERVRVDTSGNVGIGTTSPQAKLDVSGVGNFSTGYNTFVGDGLHIQCAGTSGNGNYAGGISFSRISSDNNTRAAGIAAVQTETDVDRVGLAFFTHDTNTTANDLVEAMRIDSAGNVGIGNNNPSAKLEIGSTSGYGLKVTDDDSWSTISVAGGGGTDNLLELTNFGSSASGSILRTTGTGHLRLAAGNTEAIRILGTNQRVSIGQTNFTPASTLHVGGTISVGATNATLQLHEGSSFTPTNGTQKTWAIVENIKNSENLAFRQKGDDTTDRMSFFTQYSGQSSFTERLSIISQTGYVGINETVPSTFLEVGSGGVHGIKLGPDTSNTDNSGRLFFEGDATSVIMHTGTGLSLRTGATLGTSSGTQRLHVGTGSIAASVPFKAPGGTAAAPALYFSTDTNTGLYRVSENVLGFSSAGQVRFTVGDNVVDVLASKLKGTSPNTAATGTILQGITPEVAFEAQGDFDYRHYNHLAGADKRLTVSISKNDVAQTVSTSKTIFRGDSNQIQHTLGASSELLIITIEDIPAVTYSAWVGINFGSNTFVAKNVKIETFRNGAWQTECDLTNQLNNTVVRQVANNNADGVQKVRYTLSNPYNSSSLHIRINNVFLIHYNTGRELYGYDVNRYDDTSIYGDLTILDNNNITLTGSGTGGNSRITFNNTDASWDWYQYQQNNGQLEFTVTGTGGAELVLDTDGSDHNNARLNIGSGAGTLEVGTVKAGNGSSSAPSLTFGTDTNTGIFRAAADEIGFSAGGSEKMRLHGPQLLIGTTDPSNLLSNSTAALAIGSPFFGTSASLSVNGFARFSDGIFISEDGGSNASNYVGINYSAGKITATGKSGSGLNAFEATDGYYVGSSQVITGTRELDNITGLTIDNSDSNGVRINTTDTVVNQAFNGVFIDHNCSGSDAATADRAHTALFIDMDSSATGGDTSNEHRMYGVFSDVRCTGDSDDINGVYGRAESNNNTSQVTNIRGLYGIGISDDSGTGRTSSVFGVVGIGQAGGTGDNTLGETTVYGGNFKAQLLAAQTTDRVSAMYGLHAEVEIDPAVNCSIGTVAAVRADFDNDSGTDVAITNSYLFYGDYQGTINATNAYGIRILDNVQNRFRGEVRSDNSFLVKAAGTQDVPTYTFVGDTDTGMYQAAADDLRFTVGGTYEVQITSGTVNVVNTLRAQTIEVKSNSVATVTDLLFADNANIGATQSMNFIVDTDNNNPDSTFTWRKNGPGTDASTEIMKLEEDGDLTLTGDIKLPNTVTQTTASITSTNTAEQVLAEWSATTHNGAKATITAVRGGLVETVEILIANTSSTVNHTQFGSVLVGTGVNFTTYTATISGGNVQLRVTPNASTSTNYTAFVTLT